MTSPRVLKSSLVLCTLLVGCGSMDATVGGNGGASSNGGGSAAGGGACTADGVPYGSVNFKYY